MEQEKKSVDYTMRGIIIFSPIILVLVAVLVFVGYNICYTPVTLDKGILFGFFIFFLSTLLVSIGVVWYKGFKESVQYPEEKPGKKRIETDGIYIGILITGLVFFICLSGIIYKACRDYITQGATKALRGIDPLMFVTLSEAVLAAILVTLSIGALVLIGIIKYKEMSMITVEEPQNAGKRLHQFLVLSRNRK